jgi:hypothetical protein
MYMPAFQAKKLVKGVSDETEVSDLQGTLPRQMVSHIEETQTGRHRCHLSRRLKRAIAAPAAP